MYAAKHTAPYALAAFLVSFGLGAQPQGRGPQPEFLRQGQQLARQGKLDEALALYQKELQSTPDSVPANNAAGVVLDLMGRGEEARKHFAKAIEAAVDPQAKAAARRSMAMSWAFQGNCQKTADLENQVYEYYVSIKDFYQQGEILDEAARVCIDAGDLDAAARLYKRGHDAGLQEPDIKPDRVSLWNFRLENAQARIAARRGNKAEAAAHVAAAKAIFEKDDEMAKAQAPFLPYLVGYVAYYGGDYKAAIEELQKANQNDPFIMCLMAGAYERLGEKDKAMELYRKASTTSAHNPPAAYAQPFAKKKLAAGA